MSLRESLPYFAIESLGETYTWRVACDICGAHFELVTAKYTKPVKHSCSVTCQVVLEAVNA